MPHFEIVKRRNNENFPFLVDVSNYLDADNLTFNVSVFEKLLNGFFECRLSSLRFGERVKKLDICERFIKFYSNVSPEVSFYAEISKDFFGEDLKPSAMHYRNIIEMKRNVFLMYQLSYFHYVLGKYNRMKGEFPYFCCGRSSRNLLTALWEAGVISAIQVCNNKNDHSYNIVPFIVETPRIEGVIVIDPTSDQLIHGEDRKIRNNVMIMTEKKWVYKTDWKGGSDLYPDEVETAACYGSCSQEYEEYVRETFLNPVVVL